VIVLPTDTVYGLAARPDRPDAVERIFALKGRPRAKVLQVLVPSVDWFERLGRPSEQALALAHRYWPGPLTLIVPATSEAPLTVAGDGNIGVRLPAHRLAGEVLVQTGPLAATSANLSGEQTPIDLDGVRDLFADGIDAYVDGGRIEGRASTVVDLTGSVPVVRREGVISADEIDRALKFGFEPG
jgi:tRNA threonylcarbamoyl adenosine modification protein (Sua5/YciO/YrdC/YwlC family)